jgi:hypothetical protein
MRLHSLLGAAGCLLLCSAFTFGATPQTFITLISQPGDYIGQGITQTLTAADGTFTVSNSANTAYITFHNADYSQFWMLNFGPALSFSGLGNTRIERLWRWARMQHSYRKFPGAPRVVHHEQRAAKFLGEF